MFWSITVTEKRMMKRCEILKDEKQSQQFSRFPYKFLPSSLYILMFMKINIMKSS